MASIPRRNAAKKSANLTNSALSPANHVTHNITAITTITPMTYTRSLYFFILYLAQLFVAVLARVLLRLTPLRPSTLVGEPAEKAKHGTQR